MNLKDKKVWFKYLILAGAIVLISPILANTLSGVFTFGQTWIQLVSILITLVLVDIITSKLLKL